LIAHQRQDLGNNKGNTNLSNSCNNPYYFIKVGYIDSLEYNVSKSEGIVKNNLRKVDIKFPLITGSDCHKWECYPYHSSDEGRNRDFTTCKALPTFRGLLLTITSFQTRINRRKNNNEYYLKSISIGEKEYPLSNGLNAIIGDNGVGKSLLVDYIAGKKSGYYKKLVEVNQLKLKFNTEDFQESYVEYISQGYINTEVRKGKLFENEGENSYYNEIPNKQDFKNDIIKYFNKLHKCISHNINISEKFKKLNTTDLKIELVNRNFYIPVIESNIALEEIDETSQRNTQMKSIIKQLKDELVANQLYYKKMFLFNRINDSIKELTSIQLVLETKYNFIEARNRVRGIIQKHLVFYANEVEPKRTNLEQKETEKLENYNNFRIQILDFIKMGNVENNFPIFPQKKEGKSRKQYRGYEFKKVAKYHDVDLEEDFFKAIFNSNFRNIEAIKNIKTTEEFSAALSQYQASDIEIFKEKKVNSFINDWMEDSTFISEIDGDGEIGNTPGENALVYYKFLIQESEKEFYMLVIDQPEDDINPKRIKNFLLNFLSSIRDKKQVILVTHNPLLVVNLDVDNVIYVKKESQKISIKYGALEHEGNDYTVLDLVKDNLDGGYKAIERRLKVYERDFD
jgi:predicted ATPase